MRAIGKMAEANTDGDGFISLDKFAAPNVTVTSDVVAVKEDLRHTFRVFDDDGSVTVSAAELVRVLHSLGEFASIAKCHRMVEGVDPSSDDL